MLSIQELQSLQGELGSKPLQRIAPGQWQIRNRKRDLWIGPGHHGTHFAPVSKSNGAPRF